MDVDGTLTDGRLYIGESSEIMKSFHVQDGFGIANILPKAGITPAIITGRYSKIVDRRALELNISHVYQGVANKLSRLKELAVELNVSAEEIAYIGDDLNDLECIQYCGYTACPSNAVSILKNTVDFVCSHAGGCGAVREFIDTLAQIQ